MAMVAIVLFMTCASVAQSSTELARPRDIALAYLREHQPALGLAPADLDDVIVTGEEISEHTGVAHIRLRQRYLGIEVSGADINVNVAKDGRILGSGGRFISSVAAAVNRPASTIGPIQAVEAAARHLNLRITEPIALAAGAEKGPAREVSLTDGGISATPIPVKLVFHPSGSNKLRLAWRLEIEQPDGEHWWIVSIDAESGELLDKHDLVVRGRVQ